MGNGNWSDKDYSARQAFRAAHKTSAFVYDQTVRQTGNIKVHPDLNPGKKNSQGQIIRESRDSVNHPDSRAIAVFMDVSGSQKRCPVVFQQKLSQLMAVLIKKGYTKHPQICYGAIGNYVGDRVPLQVSEFESDLLQDDQLSKIYLEGGGGSPYYESYELAFYFMARHTALDCLEKRGEKGYLFFTADEHFYDQVKRTEVRDLIGDDLESDIPTLTIIKELQKMYHVFCIIPTETSGGRNSEIHDFWRNIFGENVLLLEDAGALCETIAMAIGWTEGAVNNVRQAANDLIDVGSDRSSVVAASNAIAPFMKNSRTVTRAGVSNLPSCSVDVGDVGLL